MNTNYIKLREKIFKSGLALEEKIKVASISEKAILVSINTKLLLVRKLLSELDHAFIDIEMSVDNGRDMLLLDQKTDELITDCIKFYQEVL